MKLFGTDGIRDLANTGPLTPDMLVRLGAAIGHVLWRSRESGGQRPRVLVGCDTRLSGALVEKGLSAGLLGAGVDVGDLGVAPTPVIAYLARTQPFDCGIAVSASHNDFPDNGIKIFAHDGRKVSDAIEESIESFAVRGIGRPRRPTGADLGRAVSACQVERAYERGLVRRFRRVLGKRPGIRLVIDCAHGAAFEIAPRVLKSLSLGAHVLHAQPDGANINHQCGALHPNVAGREVKKRRADLGAALDGDGDRLILLDERGRVVDGDHMLAFWARYLKERRKLPGAVVVGTVMANLGLERSLDQAGIRLLRAPVGDRFVLERMLAERAVLGGEQSGHMIVLDGFQTTGDGLFTLLSVLAIMKSTGKTLSELAAAMKKLPQVLLNVPVARKVPFEDLPGARRVIAQVEQELGPRGRVLVRYSGTERKARVMIEGPGKAGIENQARRIADAIRREIGQDEG